MGLFGQIFAPGKSGKCKQNPAMRTRHEAELIRTETAGTAAEAGETQNLERRRSRSRNGGRPLRLAPSISCSRARTAGSLRGRSAGGAEAGCILVTHGGAD